ncbi:root hair defective 3 GTP-binding protein-domain-containing protein [Phascolomyces articulosus]|uniref:Root hair defective 3 GTP-binding protein-domain-containing protein n=1 Tax=Phascolomyces articulosus TaxID=60185 RepID=A0AAD5KAK0_9FUNG|nr:root hair defective 3 GTP-binding protein-domain-containing protein [Phascolomyces articulosus]
MLSNGTNTGSSSQPVQIIDGDNHFNNDVTLLDMMSQFYIDDIKSDYHVVSIFGSQSTGKSTLLNQLFGLSFTVLDKQKGPGQTTKGIWIACANELPILVMDVEGTDGSQRGEDKNFERKSALFAMATSDVVIFNLKTDQVGLHHGANLHLLESVFQANLKLFPARQNERRQKTRILVVIRDHDEVDSIPFNFLQNELETNFRETWSRLHNPAESTISDYFDFTFIRLSNADSRFTANEFKNEVGDLHRRFVDPRHEEYLFDPDYQRKTPIDGFQQYALSIWEIIKSDSGLDLPTQKILLAHLKCSEYSKAAFTQFTEQIKEIEDQVFAYDTKKVTASNVDVQNMRNIVSESIDFYNKMVLGYEESVCKENCKKLVYDINAIVYKIFTGQLANLREQALDKFDEGIQKVRNDSSLNHDAKARKISDLRSDAQQYFLEGANKMIHSVEKDDWVKNQWEFKKLTEALDRLSMNVNNPKVYEDELRRTKENMMYLKKQSKSANLMKGLGAGIGVSAALLAAAVMPVPVPPEVIVAAGTLAARTYLGQS